MKKWITISILMAAVLLLSSCGKKEAAELSGDVCYVTIDCQTALSYAGISADKLEVLPKDGKILTKYAVEITDGMTAIGAFEKACKDNKLQFEYATMSGMKYVDGISNLYSGDCSELSGWFFFYNGESPSVGMQEIKVEKDAELTLLYSCDMGADIGASM